MCAASHYRRRVSRGSLREIADILDGPDRGLVLHVLHDSGYAEFAAAEIRTAVAADPGWPGGSPCGPAGWLARRCPRPAVSPPSGPRSPRSSGGATGSTYPGLFGRLTTAHTARMAFVGRND